MHVAKSSLLQHVNNSLETYTVAIKNNNKDREA